MKNELSKIFDVLKLKVQYIKNKYLYSDPPSNVNHDIYTL